jgi:hypothetical protein
MFDYEKSLLAVKSYMESRGVNYYTTYPANKCVGVAYGRVSGYCIMNADNTVVLDFIID